MVQVLNATNVTSFKCYKCYKFPIVSNATHVTEVSNAEISTHTQLHESCPLLHVYQEHFAVQYKCYANVTCLQRYTAHVLNATHVTSFKWVHSSHSLHERSPLLHVWCIMYTLQCGTSATQIHSSFSSFKCCTCRYRLTLNWSPPLLPFTQIHSSFSSFKYCTCYKFQVDSHSIAREQSTVTYVPRSLLLAIDVVNSARRGFGRERETYFDRNN